MALLSATDAIIPVEQRYLETTGMLSAMNQIIEIRDGWERPNLRIKGILVTKMDKRIKGHLDSPQNLQEHQALGQLLCGVIPIRDDGQVNPLTIINVSQGASIQYRIETGERRYWATWLLREFFSGYTHDGKIPCIVVPADKASAFRQAKENTACSGLNAIAMMRQVALLLLTVHGYEMLNFAVGMDFYRQALDLDLRGKRDFTEAVLSALGGISL